MAGSYNEYGDNNRITNFAREWLMEYQKEDSVLLDVVTVDTNFTGEYKMFEKIGQAADWQERTQRNETIDVNLVNTNRRRMSKNTYHTNHAFDTIDELYGSLDVTSPMSKQMMYKANVKKDQIIFTAALAAAAEGKAGATSVAFPSANIIDSSGTTGATFAKLKELRKKAKLNYVKDELYWFVTPYQMNELLSISELINADFNSQRFLENGKVLRWWNINIVESDVLAIPLDSGGTYRRTVAMTKGAVVFGLTQDVNMRKYDLMPQNTGVMLYADMTAGACRVQDEGVYEIRCLES